VLFAGPRSADLILEGNQNNGNKSGAALRGEDPQEGERYNKAMVKEEHLGRYSGVGMVQ
jgi:hypothetical protein